MLSHTKCNIEIFRSYIRYLVYDYVIITLSTNNGKSYEDHLTH